jgi:two-component system NarL family response regulator
LARNGPPDIDDQSEAAARELSMTRKQLDKLRMPAMQDFGGARPGNAVPDSSDAPVTPSEGVKCSFRHKEASVVLVESRERRSWWRTLDSRFSVCDARDRSELEQSVIGLLPDVLVIDLALPGLRRERGLPSIQRLSPSTKIIAVTDAYSEEEGLDVLKAGAKGYCARIDPVNLSKAVAAVLNGEIWASRKLFRALVVEFVALAESRNKNVPRRVPDPRLEQLTERQHLVALLMSRGASNKEIGNRLNISERTVKAHLTEAFRNVGVSDRLQLALLLRGVSSSNGDD